MSEEFFTSEEGNVFVQQDRDSSFEWLTCTGVGDITIPGGDRTPVYCPVPGASGEWEIAGFIKGDAGAGTYTLTKPLVSVYNFLMEHKCDFAMRINWVCAGLRADERNYDVALVIPDGEATSRGVTNAARTPDGSAARVLTNSDVSFRKAVMIYPLSIRRQTVTNTAEALSVFFMPELCETRCKDRRLLCEVGVIGLINAPGYMYDSEVKVTTDGSTWGQSATDPFTWGGDVGTVLGFDIRDGYRLIAFRRTALPGAPAEAAYSDNGGATWTNIALPGGNGLAVLGATIQGANIIAVGTSGYIWKSTDLAETFTVEDPGTATTQDLYRVAFHNDSLGYAAGDSNAVVITEDGSTWAALTGPAAGVNFRALDTNDKGHIFLSGNDGNVYRSTNKGTSWVTWRALGGGTITWIAFDHETDYIGSLSWNSPSGMGYLYRSEDGGVSWYQVSNMPTNSGINDGHMCDHNYVFLVGPVNNGSTFIARVQPAA